MSQPDQARPLTGEPRRPDISLILPAYNEVNVIGRTLDAAQAYFEKHGLRYEIIAVVDGEDGTRELVAERASQDPRIKLIANSGRRGKGFAVRAAAQEAEGKVVGFVDADNKIPIAELDHALPCFDEGYDLVIGSRALEGSRIEVYQPWYRRLGSKGFGVVMHLLAGLDEVPDTQCGFKFFRGEVARDLFSRQKIDGYMFDVELLYLATRLGYRLKQIGIRWRDDGDSRLQLLRGNLRSGLDLLRLRLWLHRPRLSNLDPTGSLNVQVKDV